MTNSDTSQARALAEQHKEEILKAVSKEYGLPVSGLTLLMEESFESEKEPGSYCFTILHASGLYGVYAPQDDEGHFKDFIASVL